MAPISIRAVSSFECWSFLKNNISDSILIDVRTEDEWKNYGVPDLSYIGKQLELVTLSISNQEEFIEELSKKLVNKDANIFFICASGGRSAKAAELATNHGYINVFNVSDGFLGNRLAEDYKLLNVNGWKNINLPWRVL